MVLPLSCAELDHTLCPCFPAGQRVTSYGAGHPYHELVDSGASTGILVASAQSLLLVPETVLHPSPKAVGTVPPLRVSYAGRTWSIEDHPAARLLMPRMHFPNTRKYRP